MMLPMRTSTKFSPWTSNRSTTPPTLSYHICKRKATAAHSSLLLPRPVFAHDQDWLGTMLQKPQLSMQPILWVLSTRKIIFDSILSARLLRLELACEYASICASFANWPCSPERNSSWANQRMRRLSWLPCRLDEDLRRGMLQMLVASLHPMRQIISLV